ncbi:MAG: hypothetical protein VST67_05235 [Nitrospirota bacterium]|nr:hypothetical protein [Nitrospirota bacterium]
MLRKVIFLFLIVLLPSGALAQFDLFDTKASGEEKESHGSSGESVQLAQPTPSLNVGRFQVIASPNDPKTTFLLDTATGCVWSQVENTETKRMTFVEVDVENLHWSYGSGAQQLLAERIEASNLTDEQKTGLKGELRKTGCGLSSNLVLTPGRRNPSK